MSERKVLNKYYPPDYDPGKVPRVKRKNNQTDVRLMAPVSIRCSACNEYIAQGTKFNMKKETVEDEAYEGLHIFRFYMKCPRCMNPITFKTNPKTKAYEMELGATENFKRLKDAERQAQEEAEAEVEEAKNDPMKKLESQTKASKQQMEASEQIQNLRMAKHKLNHVNIDSVIEAIRQEADQETRPAIAAPGYEDEISREAKRLFAMKKIDQTTPSRAPALGAPGNPSKKSSNTSSSLANLKKKIKVTPKATTPSSSSTDVKT